MGRIAALLALALALSACAGSPEPHASRGRTPPTVSSHSGPSHSGPSHAGPLRAAKAAPKVTLLVVGDLMLERGVPDPTAALAPMAPRLRGADLTVGNLEGTLSTEGTPTQGEDSFGGSAALVQPLANVGFDAVSLANNHTGDYGTDALLATVHTLSRSPIRPFGAGDDVAAAARPAYLRRKGVIFAFLGFNAIGETPRATARRPGALEVRMPPRTGPLDTADLRRVTRAIRRASHRADVVVVMPHWGMQYTHVPVPAQRVVARRLVAAGADLVVGGHPHWVQPLTRIRDVPVDYSLGNFVFDMDFSAETMEGVMLRATFRGADLRRVRLVPYRLDPVTFAPRVVHGAAAAEIQREAYEGPLGPERER